MKLFARLSFGASIAVLAAIAAVAQQQIDGGGVEELTFLGEPVTAGTIITGQEVYAESCASCHGASLEGQPDWQRPLDNGRMPAPPHDETGHTWHHSDRNLFKITKDGIGAIVPGYKSDMLPFVDILSDTEIAAVLLYIKSTWPERQRGFQAEVSANDRGGL